MHSPRQIEKILFDEEINIRTIPCEREKSLFDEAINMGKNQFIGRDYIDRFLLLQNHIK